MGYKAVRFALATGLLSSLIALGVVACGGGSSSTSSTSSFSGPSGTGTYTLLYSFGSAAGDGTNPDGLIQGTDGNLYGTTYSGGTQDSGTVFKISPSSGAETVLYSFGSVTGDGKSPSAGLLQGSDGNLYGTTCDGGTQSSGTVFEISPSTAAETVVYSFGSAADDGECPTADLVQDSDGNLYGTTVNGGGNSSCTGGCGTVFEVSSSGMETVLHAFGGASASPADGANPTAGLILSDGNLYGTTSVGGTYSSGTAFMVSASSGTETVLYSFAGGGGVDGDGAYPEGALTLASDGDFYGTTVNGGGAPDCTGGCGTVFEYSPSSKTETVVYPFEGVYGENPAAGLIQGSDGNLYGTTYDGGKSGYGVVFMMSPSTGAETVLYAFAGAYGEYPVAGLIQGSDGSFYGTTADGGADNSGVVFKVSP